MLVGRSLYDSEKLLMYLKKSQLEMLLLQLEQHRLEEELKQLKKEKKSKTTFGMMGHSCKF